MSELFSTNAKVKKIAGLADTKDIGDWDNQFIKSVVRTTIGGKDCSRLSEKQLDHIDRIHEQHFA